MESKTQDCYDQATSSIDCLSKSQREEGRGGASSCLSMEREEKRERTPMDNKDSNSIVGLMDVSKFSDVEEVRDLCIWYDDKNSKVTAGTTAAVTTPLK